MSTEPEQTSEQRQAAEKQQLIESMFAPTQGMQRAIIGQKDAEKDAAARAFFGMAPAEHEE
ncbi:MAG: hypothetical protein WA880_01350 [Ornithinimicrobium sp.]